MSSAVDVHYSTLEEFLESRRSPALSRAELNLDSSDTPPPLVDLPDDLEPVDIEATSTSRAVCHQNPVRYRARPSLTDTILIRQLAPEYPDIAARAGTQVFCDESEPIFEDGTPHSVYKRLPMIAGPFEDDVYTTSSHEALVQQALTASRRASEKLNDAMKFHHPNLTTRAGSTDYHDNVTGTSQFMSQHNRDKKRVSISITSLTNEEVSNSLEVAHLSIRGSPTNHRVDILPSLNIGNAASNSASPQSDLVAPSPALSRYAISPQEFNSSQTLARIQSHPSPQSNHVSPAEFKQTLPSLETALSSVTDMPSAYTDSLSAISRRSPNHLSPYGRSPPSFTKTASTAPLSPPRFSTIPSAYSTLSRNSSNSTQSEQLSAPGSNSASTPASSVPRHSPSHSATGTQYHESDRGSPESEINGYAGSEGQTDGGSQRNANAGQGYMCPWPGCTAPPFQTQYLLNSHTNVHSNQRPHFCPVKDCPRGPGGQGFKRKNEMVRYVIAPLT